jgi:hypothetical protein
MNQDHPNEKGDLEYNVYLEERKSLIDAEREQSRLFDKAILTLAGGAFGLSMTFIKEIISDQKPNQIYWLVLAWAFFCASMLSTLISFLTSQEACSKQRISLDVDYFGDRTEQDGKIDRSNTAAICTKCLNVLSMLTFIAGTIFLSIFSIVNLLDCKE